MWAYPSESENDVTTTTETAGVRRRRNRATAGCAGILYRLKGGTGRNMAATIRTYWTHVETLRTCACELEAAGEMELAEQTWTTMQTMERRGLAAGL
jgi:hypothetical protein